MILCTKFSGRKFVKVITICSICMWTTLVITNIFTPSQNALTKTPNKSQETAKLSEEDNIRQLPLIFIGGHQSSGTGLLRILLDVHPMVRCGPEPIVTRKILAMKQSVQADWLSQSGISNDVLDNAIAGFIVSILKNMGPPAERLCQKDPSTFLYLRYLGKLFPNAKFIHAVRDGRAAITSTIVRNINPSYTSNDIPQALKHWDDITSQMLDDCQYLGNSRCMTVRYECLVIKPKKEIEKILNFLDLPWDDKLLNHEKFIYNTSMLNKYEASSVQVVKAIHKESLDAWSKNTSIIPRKLVETMHEKSKLLAKLGYASKTIPPNYEELCKVDLKLKINETDKSY
ncbi:Protein-tyrosine sulfotransferase A [Schistosoma japonicum]|uniref:Protein-tyrosine sulfotransferase n=1 Tax=Schistosoma japonicum TaxID=6182 RepID=A0A4Z2D1V8_SCHJA|nr:Protein-tyrosine sulfotransferase A [Schistosoma japonicum]TNN10378.1 Protein-tyrosine sulfotransferase A [Schistosoma japonicum]